ncbi:flagellar hook-basal body protein [Tumebacillus permanentifrigoris]|uniref:Flagellar basal-body rod protein FlgG n=1 Tax=Tumebacillus permanentifrigoris TaxID=378543 RepID=A0A316DDY5_9BACL|nr:flagellar basal body rod C-terminal domain-containing protein [Tumebacillus permanentifrigoris]PWK16244.1 flagellar basal-body rod protein FlgG [Tumebacillus permanentifrigoris]
MIRGLYIAQSGMQSNERMQEVVTNNIANANTVGYKGDTGVIRSFPDELLFRINDQQKGGAGANERTIGTLSGGAFLEEIVPRFVQGQLLASDNPHARAIIDGPPRDDQDFRRAFFPVSERQSGKVMYTRDGDFHVEQGTNFLVDSGGNYVLPVDQRSHNAVDNLRIQVGTDGKYNITDNTGAAYVPPAGNGPVQEGIVYLQDSTKLEKYGDTLYQGGTVLTANNDLVGLSSTMAEKQLEQSNVDLSASMVSMMQVMRSYEANQKMIRTLDTTLEKAVSIGRL